MEGRSCNRNQGIIARLYVKARTHLISRSRNRGVSKEDAEDQIQDLFVSMLEGKIDCSSDDEVALRQLTRINQNDAIDNFRTALRRRRLLAEAQSMRPSEVGSPPCTAVQVDQLLDRLPPEQEEAVVWNIVWGKTAAEIGEATGTTPNTVSSRIRAALRAMACMAVLLALPIKVRDVLSLVRWLLGRPRARIVVVLGVSGILFLAGQTILPPDVNDVTSEMKTGPFPQTGVILRRLDLHRPEPPKPNDIQVTPSDLPRQEPLPEKRPPVVPQTKTTPKVPGERELILRALECFNSAPEVAEAALREHARIYSIGNLVSERNELLRILAERRAGNRHEGN